MVHNRWDGLPPWRRRRSSPLDRMRQKALTECRAPWRYSAASRCCNAGEPSGRLNSSSGSECRHLRPSSPPRRISRACHTGRWRGCDRCRTRHGDGDAAFILGNARASGWHLAPVPGAGRRTARRLRSGRPTCCRLPRAWPGLRRIAAIRALSAFEVPDDRVGVDPKRRCSRRRRE